VTEMSALDASAVFVKLRLAAPSPDDSKLHEIRCGAANKERSTIMSGLDSLRIRLVEAMRTSNPTAELTIGEFGYRLYPNDPWWATQYGRALAQIGRDSDAERILLAAHPKRAKNREHVEWTLGKVCAHQGRFEEAEKWFRIATETNPDDTGPWVMLGAFLANRQRFREACEVLERGLHAEGDRDEVYYNLGLNKRTLGDLQGAQECFEAALRICPDYSLAQSSLSDITEALRLRDEFGPEVEQAIATTHGAQGNGNGQGSQ
jgi:tetratricopeptide (TPR) repeat protein